MNDKVSDLLLDSLKNNLSAFFSNLHNDANWKEIVIGSGKIIEAKTPWKTFTLVPPQLIELRGKAEISLSFYDYPLIEPEVSKKGIMITFPPELALEDEKAIMMIKEGIAIRPSDTKENFYKGAIIFWEHEGQYLLFGALLRNVYFRSEFKYDYDVFPLVVEFIDIADDVYSIINAFTKRYIERVFEVLSFILTGIHPKRISLRRYKKTEKILNVLLKTYTTAESYAESLSYFSFDKLKELSESISVNSYPSYVIKRITRKTNIERLKKFIDLIVKINPGKKDRFGYYDFGEDLTFDLIRQVAYDNLLMMREFIKYHLFIKFLDEVYLDKLEFKYPLEKLTEDIIDILRDLLNSSFPIFLQKALADLLVRAHHKIRAATYIASRILGIEIYQYSKPDLITLLTMITISDKFGIPKKELIIEAIMLIKSGDISFLIDKKSILADLGNILDSIFDLSSEIGYDAAIDIGMKLLIEIVRSDRWYYVDCIKCPENRVQRFLFDILTRFIESGHILKRSTNFIDFIIKITKICGESIDVRRLFDLLLNKKEYSILRELIKSADRNIKSILKEYVNSIILTNDLELILEALITLDSWDESLINKLIELIKDNYASLISTYLTVKRYFFDPLKDRRLNKRQKMSLKLILKKLSKLIQDQEKRTRQAIIIRI